MLARNPGEAERRLVRCAAEAAVAAVSQRDIREAIVKAGLPVVLDVYATFSGPTKVKLLQLLATMSLHDPAVRTRIFQEVDFLQFNRADDEAGVLQAVTYLALHGSFKQKLWQKKAVLDELLGALTLPDDPRRKQAAGSYAHFVHHLIRSREDKVKMRRDEYPFNQMTEEEAEQLLKLRDLMPEEQRPKVNGDFDAGDAAVAKEMRAHIAQHPHVVKTLSEATSNCTPAVLASIFKLLCMEPDNRKWVVKNGGIRTLLALRSEEDAKQALAQICIVVNPNLFSYQEAFDSLHMILDLLKHNDELYQFEGAMGATNLLTLGSEMVTSAVQADAWAKFLDLIEGDDGNPLLARAGLEGLCNLSMSEEIHDRIKKGRHKTDLQIILAYTRMDDVEAQVAATGAIAMLVQDPEICKIIAKIEGWRNLVPALLGSDERVVHRAAPAALARAQEEDHYRTVLGKAYRYLTPEELAAVEDPGVELRERLSRLMHIAQTKPELR